jgi:hypothetical protein
MPRLALKPDSSFFRKIVIGAIGTRAVSRDLAEHGHEIVELERGSLDTKLWKDVKRKRVRIPDLVCLRCGLRVESRAKTNSELSMSHSTADEARAWDFGMVDADLIAFPVCGATDEKYWSAGQLSEESSYWHERNWVRWSCAKHINYFNTREFRSAPYSKTAMKGVTEGSETTVGWDAVFSARNGTVEKLDARRITIRRESDGHRHTRTIPEHLKLFVSLGEIVETNQVIAGAVTPLRHSDLGCTGRLPENYISHLLTSRERTQRFTGVKLARLRGEGSYCEPIEDLANDKEEDVYVRLEAVSYQAAVCAYPEPALFKTYLESPDEQTQLEAVIALGEAATPGAVELLWEILDDNSQPYFLRSAAAWSLSRAGRDESISKLVRSFNDFDLNIREEALQGIVSIGGPAIPVLLANLAGIDKDIAAGCAEALRRQQPLSEEALSIIVESLKGAEPSEWSVWLAGHIPRDRIAVEIAALQDSAPKLHYAITLLWSFVESWIARRWELNARA